MNLKNGFVPCLHSKKKEDNHNNNKNLFNHSRKQKKAIDNDEILKNLEN